VNILVVCSGNICRSPMAEAYLRHRLAGSDNSNRFRVSSAGTLGITDDRPAAMAVAIVAEETGIDLSPHRTRGLNREEVEDADLILVMEGRHRRYLSTLYPAHVGKVRLLTEYAPPGGGVSAGADIFDPVGMEPDAFRACFRMIRVCLDALVDELRE
jgi:protein-tyrosine phosphatase